MPASKKQKTGVGISSWDVDGEAIAGLLTKLMKHNRKLQNNPPALVPQEELAADEVIEFLKPVTTPNGPLVIKKCMYVPGRCNLIITYPCAESEECVSFVGSHFDVVACGDAEEWERDPYQMTRDGDKIFGRGVTDCLGHVATISCFMKLLGEKKPTLNKSVHVVFIANEEDSSIPGVGIDEMMKHKELDHLKNGPLFWVDSANYGPTLATAGMCTWEMLATGKKFHSGIPQNGINPINLANLAISEIQRRFYEDFPKSTKEEQFKFQVGSSLKPTQIRVPPGSINQIPLQCFVSGDVRITPFHTLDTIKAKVEGYVADFNSKMDEHKDIGYGKFSLPDAKGSITWKWTTESPMRGVACDLSSPGYAAIKAAIDEVTGENDITFSLTGSLPLIADLKDAGYDVQVCGFGRMDAYHALNEYALLSDLVNGTKVMFKVVGTLCA